MDEATAKIAAENIGMGQVQEWNANSFIEKHAALALKAPEVSDVLIDPFEDDPLF